MKEKHIKIDSDNVLLNYIYKSVDSELELDSNKYYRIIWTKFIFYFLVTISLYLSLFVIENTALFILAFMAYGYSALLFAFNFAHDFSHNTIFKSKKLNNLSFVLLYTLVGAHGEAWKERHIHSHHYAPNVEKYDLDLQISSWIRVIPGSEYRWFHRYQHIYAPFAYMTYSLFWVFVKDFVHLVGEDEFIKKKDWRYYGSFIFQKTFYLSYLLILPLLFAPHTWGIVLVAFLSMHLSQSLFLLFTFFMTHHVEDIAYPDIDENGYIQMSWLRNQIESSNDFFPFSEPANFIFGGFNNHIAHHLFPHIHHIHYPQLNRVLYKILKEKGITPNETTFFGGVLSHLKHLQRLSVV